MSNAPFASQVLELFRGPLAEVRFPDVDREVLERAEGEVLEAQRRVERAELALAEARAELVERSAALAAQARRGLEYSRIYAGDDPALRERVQAIAQPAAVEAAAPAPRPRGRRRRRAHGTEEATLFEGAAATEE